MCSSLKYNQTIFPSSERLVLTMTTELACGKGASCGFSVTLAAATQWVWPVEALWLITESILKFWLLHTKVEDESLQIILALQNLQNIWFASESYMSHGKSFNHVRTNFWYNEDWDVLLSESSLPLLRVGVLVAWYDPCSDDSDAFDDRNALISITRTITSGDRRFAFQDGGQALFDSTASQVYDLVPCFPDKAKSIWRRRNMNAYTK